MRRFAGVSLCLLLPLSLCTFIVTFNVAEHSVPGLRPHSVEDPGLGLLICSFAGGSHEW
jgi:hypothetical protein